jgi:GNAT superfamily N-acetyltransferase
MALDLKTSARLIAAALHLGVDELQGSLRKAHLRDLPLVCQLRQRAFGSAMGGDDQRHLAWKYGFGDPREPWSTLWILEVDGKILCCVGVERVTLCLDGNCFDAGIAMDLVVDPERDGLGIGVWLNLSLLEREGALLTVGGNDSSRRLIDRLFMKVATRETLTFGIRSSQLLRNSSQRRRLAFAGPIMDLLCEARHARGGVETAMLRRFDARVADLWSRAQPSAGLVVRRDADHLNWRYLENPRGGYRAFAAVTRNELVGYVVVREGRLPDGSLELWLVDHLVAPALCESALSALIGCVLTQARESGAVAIRVATFDPLVSATFRRQGFIAGTPGGAPCTMLIKNPDMRLRLERGATRCHITELANDNDG